MIVGLARARGVDPFLVVAYIDSESRWNARAVNPRSGTRGLGQVDPRWYNGDPDQLFDPLVNIRQTIVMMGAARLYCARYSARAEDWLQITTGWDAVRGTHCGHLHGRRLPVPPAVLSVVRAAQH